MLTLFLIIILTNFKLISGLEINDTKFINSLPEKQKKEFLQKVEKRIQNEVPEVKSPELNDTNVDLYEKRLEDQGKSIQNILRSEIENLKNHHRRNLNDTERIEASHIDLTLRSNNDISEATRRKGEGNKIVEDIKNIPVIIQYDSKDVNNHKHSLIDTSIKIQNTVPQADKNESKVAEITWENINLTTKSVNVNDSSTEHKRTGRRSNDFDSTFENVDNTTLEIGDNSANSSLDFINDTTTVNTESYHVDSTKTTNYALGVSLNQDSDIYKTESVAFDTLKMNTEKSQGDHKSTNNASRVENNTLLEKITEISSTLSYSKSDAKVSNSTAKSLQTKSVVVVDTTAQYNESTQTHYELSTTTQYYFDEKTSKPTTIIDNGNATIHDLDSSSTVSDKLTATKKVDPSITETTTIDSANETTNNILSIQISDVNADTRKDYHTSTTESNNLESDLHRKENSEKQTHYVPVYNYDPENAYYNANNKQSNGNVEEESIIKIKETHSKSTNFDVYTDENKKSLRVKDVKERMISNNKIIQTSDLYDIILSDVSEESPEDSVFIEKPLKHTLKKIRTKLYKNKINGKSKDGVNNNDIITITAENKDEVDNSSNTDNNEKKSIAELFTNFGALLQNMVDRANDNETPSSEGKKDSDNNGNDSDKTSYKDIANSLENHNKVLNTKGIQQIVTVIKYIQDKLGEKSKNKRNKKQHQSRFHVKHRDEKYKQKQERIYASFVQNDINYPNFESQDQKIGKSASKIKDDYLEIHINILKNLIDRNDLGLEKYDWLGTTVFIRAGLEKIQEITEKRLQGKKLHRLDQKLLEFVMELYKSAKEIVESQANEQQLSSTQRKKVSSKISKPKKGKKLNRLHRRLLYSESIGGLNKVRTVASSKSDVEDFKESLDCLEMCLNDLHTAIKQISLITTYKKQHWFENIKQLYLQSANEKEYLELFLHLVMARLMDLIDARAKKMNTEDDNFLKRDKVAVDRIEVEFVLAMKICIKIAELRE